MNPSRSSLTVARLLWIAFTSAPLFYSALIFIIPSPSAPAGPPENLKLILWGVAVLLAVAAHVLVLRVSTTPLVQDPGTLADDAVQSQRLMLAFLVRVACIEAIGVLGLVYHLLGGERFDALAFAAVSLVLLLMAFPRQSGWEPPR